MSKRNYRHVAAATAVVVLLAWGILEAQERAGGTVKREAQNRASATANAESSHASHGRSMEACAAACADCQRSCDSCAAHCLSMVADGHKDHRQTLQTCLDCADICAAADRIVSRSGPFSDAICRACAEACDRCAKACEQFPDDEHMAKCAKECRKCQRACEEMIDGHPQAGRSGQPNSKNR